LVITVVQVGQVERLVVGLFGGLVVAERRDPVVAERGLGVADKNLGVAGLAVKVLMIIPRLLFL